MEVPGGDDVGISGGAESDGRTDDDDDEDDDEGAAPHADTPHTARPRRCVGVLQVTSFSCSSSDRSLRSEAQGSERHGPPARTYVRT